MKTVRLILILATVIWCVHEVTRCWVATAAIKAGVPVLKPKK